jgi:lipopolysaccharide/colanic/teichoic acid biosynthesis glycosyltransferase
MNAESKPHPIHRAKRTFDVVFGLLLTIVLVPIFILFFLLIFIEHVVRLRPRDPLLYSEIRFSAGKPFSLYKFNIFKHNIVESMRARGEYIQTKDLERNGSLLIVGFLLKQIYLDELPQLINVLRGDMSIVGPRPVNSVTRQALLDKGVTAKEMAQAGMTGLYQASHKIARGGRSQEELDYEYAEYLQTHTWYEILRYDICIILKTIKVILLAKGI